MSKPSVLPEIVFGSSDAAESMRIGRLVTAGTLRPLAPRIYTSNLKEKPADIVKRNVWRIGAHLFPGAVVSHRTAIETRPAADGSIFLTYKHRRNFEIEGITYKAVKGPGPMDGDNLLMGIHLSSRARALLENLTPSRERGGVARTLSRAELEAYLDRMIRASDATALNRLRDQARQLAPKLGLEAEFEKLDRLIGALLGTRTDKLDSDLARARIEGGYDPACVSRLELLFAELRKDPPPVIGSTAADRSIEAFYEAYFSNYIEGTEFEVDEAREIVFDAKIPQSRPEDGRDVIATYQLVVNLPKAASQCKDANEFLDVLKAAHAMLMEARRDIRPGEFKSDRNRAGMTSFVEPDLVEGTLRRGFEFVRAAEDAFARAVLVHFLVSEVHPFADGNGRMSRLMMSAELELAGLQHAIIPNVFRDDYLTSLRALSRHENPRPFVRVITFAQEVMRAVNFTSFEAAKADLTSANAFEKPSASIKLEMPGRGARENVAKADEIRPADPSSSKPT